MGVLDDAIREHLELKRRHGASEEELAVKEEEALGAARGEAPPEPAPAAEGADAGDGDDEGADLFDMESAGDPPPEEQPTRFVSEPVDDPPFAEEPFAQQAPPPLEEDPFEEDPLTEPAADDPRGSDIVDQPTEAHPAPATPEADPPWAEPEQEVEGEDVLEETPDFLQETPEHDRLWFEQKPPRDFDFDDEEK